MVKRPKYRVIKYIIFETKWLFGRKALMRSVSTEYTGRPSNNLG